jgi:hypothetical protein
MSLVDAHVETDAPLAAIRQLDGEVHCSGAEQTRRDEAPLRIARFRMFDLEDVGAPFREDRARCWHVGPRGDLEHTDTVEQLDHRFPHSSTAVETWSIVGAPTHRRRRLSWLWRSSVASGAAPPWGARAWLASVAWVASAASPPSDASPAGRDSRTSHAPSRAHYSSCRRSSHWPTCLTSNRPGRR